MCRDVAIDIINCILEDIYNNVDIDRIKAKCEEFKKKCYYEELQLEEDEIRKDRLKEYIKFFNISGICEYDIFKSKEIFYNILKENLEKRMWDDIEKFLNAGNILSDYAIE